MEIQCKVLWVGAPTQNNTASGMFYNQDVVVESLTENSTFVVRVTSGSRAKNISLFKLQQGEEVELTVYGQFGVGKDTNRPFNTLSVVGVERDRSKWGRRHGSSRDNSSLLAQLGAGTSPAPAPVAAPAALAPTDDLPF